MTQKTAFICVFLFGLIFTNQVTAKISTTTLAPECGQTTLKEKTFQWCITKPKGPISKDVLYHLHGAGGDQKRWFEYSIYESIRQEWSQLNMAQPTVISVSFGTHWLLSDVLDFQDIRLREFFVTEVMPFLEKKIGNFSGRRLLMGESMGGFNATQLMMKNKNLFSKAVLNCPAISTITPYSAPTEKIAFFKRHESYIRKDYVEWALAWVDSEFMDKKEMDQHDPLELAKQMNESSIPVLVSCGNRDQFGFNEGSETFYQIAKSRKAPVQFKLLNGGHCKIDPKLVARFLVQ